ncbi:hypothetical protein [Wolbachia endosymbiont of Frankliniella intonsa]|nr:hypothetical protein [Wolbachia endosymbiont of Frankliniella intonsa]
MPFIPRYFTYSSMTFFPHYSLSVLSIAGIGMSSTGSLPLS